MCAVLVCWLTCTSPGQCGSSTCSTRGEVHVLPVTCLPPADCGSIQPQPELCHGSDSCGSPHTSPHSPLRLVLTFRSQQHCLSCPQIIWVTVHLFSEKPTCRDLIQTVFPGVTLAKMSQGACPVFLYRKPEALVSLQQAGPGMFSSNNFS